MFQLSPALLDSENNNLIDTKLNKKPPPGLNRTLKKKNVEFEDTTTKNNDATKNKITSLGNLMSKIHNNNNEDDDTYNSTSYQANLIDESISTSLTDSLNSELAKIQKMRETGNNLPQNTFLTNANNANNANNALYNLENSNVLGNLNSAKNSLASYNESYNYSTTNNQSESPVNFDNNKLLKKLDYIIHLLEEQHNEKTNHITEELILYLFLGLFILFVLDSFARASKYHR
jgi:hypothetical protein